jgi:hypothetical protein
VSTGGGYILGEDAGHGGAGGGGGERAMGQVVDHASVQAPIGASFKGDMAVGEKHVWR